MKIDKDTDPRKAPFANCSFELCDLIGQCKAEGKCHHPAKQALQANGQEPVAWMCAFKHEDGSKVEYALDHASDGKDYLLDRMKSCNLAWIGEPVPLYLHPSDEVARLRMALSESNSLLCAILIEKRPNDEIEQQISMNREALNTGEVK